jgi:methyl-accepting chemotaxis protein
MRMSIGSRLAIGFLSMLILGAIVAGAGVINVTRLADSVTELGVSTTQMTDIVTLKSAVDRASLSVNGALEQRTDGTLASAGVVIEGLDDRVNEFLGTAKGFKADDLNALQSSAVAFNEAATGAVDLARTTSLPLPENTANVQAAVQSMNAAVITLERAEREAINAALEEAEAAGRQALMMALILGAVGLVLGIVLTVVITRSITRPLRYLVSVADKLSTGDLDTEVKLKTGDEIAELGESLERMRISLKAVFDRLRSGTRPG